MKLTKSWAIHLWARRRALIRTLLMSGLLLTAVAFILYKNNSALAFGASCLLISTCGMLFYGLSLGWRTEFEPRYWIQFKREQSSLSLIDEVISICEKNRVMYQVDFERCTIGFLTEEEYLVAKLSI